MTIILRLDHKVPVKVRFTNENGDPVTVEGVPEWGISDDTMVCVEPAADHMSAWLYPVGPSGYARLTITADSFTGWFDIELMEAIVWEDQPITEIHLGCGKLQAIFRIGPAHINHDCG